MTKTDDKKYDLEERTARFGENVIDFVKTIDRNSITNPFINQIVRSATSIGANYMEETKQVQRRTSETRFISARKKQTKQSTGCA